MLKDEVLVRPTATDPATICCKTCRQKGGRGRSNRGQRGQQKVEVFGLNGDSNCIVTTTKKSTVVINYYPLVIPAVTEQWDGVCIEQATKMASSVAAIFTVFYMMA